MPCCNLYSMRCNSTANVRLRMHAPVIFEACMLVMQVHPLHCVLP